MQSYSDQNGKHLTSIVFQMMPNCCITGTKKENRFEFLLMQFSDEHGKHLTPIPLVMMPSCCITGTEEGNRSAFILMQLYTTDGRRFLRNLCDITKTRSTRGSNWNFKMRKWPWWTVALFVKQGGRDWRSVLAGDPSATTITFKQAIFCASLSFSPPTFWLSCSTLGRGH